jgi:glyoxylase-like metal-dependent hydrolase (beta-lactamase superfamily II)
MTEVTPGIHWLKLPTLRGQSSLTHVNAYLIRGDSSFLLVDAGWNTDESFASLQRQMAETGADIKDISQIVVTHVHPDHYGQAGRLKRLSGASLALHDIEKGFIESRYVHMDNLLTQTAQLMSISGLPPEELADVRDASLGMEHNVVPTAPDVILHGGETITAGTFTFQVLWTPGHSEGHVCLYEPEKKILISGDHILPRITPNISWHPQSSENPLGKYLNSLKDLKKLDVKMVLPGHEFPFTEFRPRIDELIRHHEERNREILAAIKDEPKTAYDIVQVVTWGVSNSWQEMPLFHQRLALFETLAHLELMTIDGRLRKVSRDSVIYYQQT